MDGYAVNFEVGNCGACIRYGNECRFRASHPRQLTITRSVKSSSMSVIEATVPVSTYVAIVERCHNTVPQQKSKPFTIAQYSQLTPKLHRTIPIPEGPLLLSPFLHLDQAHVFGVDLFLVSCLAWFIQTICQAGQQPIIDRWSTATQQVRDGLGLPFGELCSP